MLTEHDIKAMCLAGESALLDYKSEQYKLDAEGNKSKFVKDMLAFANTYRPNGESGYILIGIRETERHRGEVIGIDNILDGNIYQQLVDGKANKSIPLNVATVDVEGRQVQVIEIPCYNDKRPFYTKKQFGVVRANEVYLRVCSSTEVATPDEIFQMGVLAATEAKPVLDVSVFSITGILDDGKVYSFYLESDIDPSYGTGPYDALRLGESHWEVFKWYQEEVAKLQFHVSLSNPTSVQADNVKVKVRILNKECGAKIVDAPEWENHPTVHGFRRATEKRNAAESPRSLCPGEECASFKTIHIAVDKSCEIRLAVTILGRNLKPIEKEFVFQVVRHVVSVEAHYLQEIETNVSNEASYHELLARLLGTVQTAEENSEQTPNWDVAMKLYRRAMWDKMERRLGIIK